MFLVLVTRGINRFEFFDIVQNHTTYVEILNPSNPHKVSIKPTTKITLFYSELDIDFDKPIEYCNAPYLLWLWKPCYGIFCMLSHCLIHKYELVDIQMHWSAKSEFNIEIQDWHIRTLILANLRVALVSNVQSFKTKFSPIGLILSSTLVCSWRWSCDIVLLECLKMLLRISLLFTKNISSKLFTLDYFDPDSNAFKICSNWLIFFINRTVIFIYLSIINYLRTKVNIAILSI